MSDELISPTSDVLTGQGETVTPDTSVEAAAPSVEEVSSTTTGQESTEAGGVIDASQNPDAASATVSPADEFKTNPELRTAYNEVVTKLKANQDVLDIIEQRGGADYVSLANEIYDSYIGENADATNFLKHLYDLSPTSYRNTMSALLETNKDTILNQWFGGAVSADDIQAFQQWKQSGGVTQIAQPTSGDSLEVPEFDEVTGEPIPESVRQILRNTMQQNAAFQKSQREAAEAQAAKEAEETAQRVSQSIDTYQSERLKVVGSTVDKMGLNVLATDSPEIAADKALTRNIIESATMRAFGADERARGLYQRALTHLENGEEKAAKGLSFQIEAMLANHASKVSQRVAKWMEAERKLQAVEVQQASKGTRPEISSTGAAPSAGVPAGDYKPFDNNSIDARLEALRASGRIR